MSEEEVITNSPTSNKRSKRKRTSVVWGSFEEYDNNNNIGRKCIYCERVFSQTTSTSSLKKHAERCNPKNLELTKEPLKSRIAKWVVADLQSFNVVESRFFSEMISLNETVPSRSTIKREIVNMFNIQQESMCFIILLAIFILNYFRNYRSVGITPTFSDSCN